MSLIAAVYALRRLRSKPTGYEQVSRRERGCRSAPSKRGASTVPSAAEQSRSQALPAHSPVSPHDGVPSAPTRRAGRCL